MGVGNLHIGQGIGGAQVFSPNPAIQQFGEILAQRKAKQDQDAKFLNEQLATNYDPGALRNDADKQTYLKKYTDIKQQAIDAENEKDQTKRALKIAEVRQQFGNLGAYAEESKKQAALDRQLGMEFMKNPDHYEDDSISKYKSGLDKNWDHPDVINNPSQVERRADPTKLQAEYDKLKTDQIKPTQWDNGTSKIYNFDGKKKQVIEQNRGVPIDGDNGAYEVFLHKVTSDPNWKKGLKDMYPEINTGNPTQDLALRARKYMHDQGDVHGWYDKPKEISMEGQTPDRFYAHYNYELKNPKPGTAASNEATPVMKNYVIPAIGGGLPELKKMADIIPKNNFREGETVTPEIVNGYHVLHVPEQVEIDPKIAKANADLKNKYESEPDLTGHFWNKDRKPIPFDQSDAYKKNYKDPYKPIKGGEKHDVVLDPNDKSDYATKAVEALKQLKTPMSDINTELGQKSGRGLRPELEQPKTKTVRSKEDYNKLPKGTHYIAPDGQEYVKK